MKSLVTLPNVAAVMYGNSGRVGKSGRVVIDLDPECKQRIHATLRAQGLTLKEFLLELNAGKRGKWGWKMLNCGD